ncbi:MAG: replication protein RepA, partial [Terriglobia bacterium]
GISKRRLKQLETIQLIREEREYGRQQLAYNARPFVLCGLPLRQLPKDQLYYARRNGAFFLEITAHPRFGMPFGQDRLIPIWVATLAVQQKSREVRFSSAAQILAFFSLPKDGPHYRRMVEGFQRVFAATIFFGTRQHTNGEGYADLGRFQFFDRMQLWFNTVKRQQVPNAENFDNRISLSEAFYNEINEHRIPVERNVVAALANAPGVLDFYMWLVWKTWTLKSSAVIPLVAERGLNEQLGSKEYTEPRFFRAKVKSWLRQVKDLWPQCSALIVSDGLSIMVQSSRQNPAIRAVGKTVNL